MKRYVIIGNSIAAAGCIEGIRSIDGASEITVVSAENHHVYGRPLISYYLEGKTDASRMKYRPDDFYEKNGCRVLYSKTAVEINPSDRLVTLDDGACLEYDRLCAATGSSPFVPAFDGISGVKHKFTFMTMDDALALEGAVNDGTKVLIVGAGLIGLKCAEGLAGRAEQITVCDLAPRILSSILDDECAALMQKHLEHHGLSFMLGDTPGRFKDGKAYMKSGKITEFDVLVLAVGVRANTSLLKSIGADTDRGIIVDSHMQTSLPGIYAAGDCTQGHDSSTGESRVLAILPNAYMQGYCAGVNMAGGSNVFDNAIPMNSIGFFGLHAMTAGSYSTAESGGEVYEEKPDGGIKRLFVCNGLLTGFIIIGNVERTGIYTALVRDRTPLDTLNFDTLKQNPGFLAFSQEYRRKNFGGVV